MSEEDLRWLACPACRGKLALLANAVVCQRCERRYPVEDGIAVLLVERATLGAGQG